MVDFVFLSIKTEPKGIKGWKKTFSTEVMLAGDVSTPSAIPQQEED